MSNDDPGEFEYYVSPPDVWNYVEKKRVEKHFKNFNIAKRYATKAAEHLGTILGQIASLKKLGLDNQDIITALIQPGIDKAPFVNHWQNGMFQAMRNTL